MRDCDPALSQASTTCTSPQLDSDGDEQDESSSRAAFPGLDCRHTHQHKDGPGVFGYDSSDDDGPDAEEEDDMHDLEHSSVTVGEDEMRARIADAMRGLHRLEHIIDPRELPGLAENAPQLGFRYCSSHSPLSPPERVRESWSRSHARITHLF